MFRDIPYRPKFEHFVELSQRDKPYRSADGKKRYPLGRRAYGRRYWMFSDNNQSVTAYYDDMELIKIHSDDTVEFTANRGYGQGDCGILSSMLYGWVQIQGQYGGAVYYHSRSWSEKPNSIKHPVFKGLRFHIETGTLHESSKYEVHTLNLNPKKTKILREPYEGLFKIGAQLMKVMDKNQISQEIRDTREKLKAQDILWSSRDVRQDLEEYLSNNDGVGALIHLGAVYNYKNILGWYRWGNPDSRDLASLGEKSYVAYVKKYFLNEIYNREIVNGGDVCHTSVVEGPLVKLPTNRWGQKIFVGGNEVARYS